MKHWINNHLAQASIIFWIGISLISGYFIQMFGSLIAGLIIASMKKTN